MSEVVPRAMGSLNAAPSTRAAKRVFDLECLQLSDAQALAVQAIYELAADRDDGARRELRRLSAEQRRHFLALDDRQLPALRDKMVLQRTILHEVASDRVLAICRILDESQRRRFVDMRPARVSL